jgi:hypothetical protein
LFFFPVKKYGTACVLDVEFYLTSLGQPRQFIETCGSLNPPCERQFVNFVRAVKNNSILTILYKQISNEQAAYFIV